MLTNENTIRRLRKKLNNAVANNPQTLTDENIVKLSQQLDEHIVQEQKRLALKRRKTTLKSQKQYYDG